MEGWVRKLPVEQALHGYRRVENKCANQTLKTGVHGCSLLKGQRAESTRVH